MSCIPKALRLLALLVLALLPASAGGLGEAVARGPQVRLELATAPAGPDAPVLWGGDCDAPSVHAAEVSEVESEEEESQGGASSLDAFRSARRVRPPIRFVRPVGAHLRPTRERVGCDRARAPPAPLA